MKLDPDRPESWPKDVIKRAEAQRNVLFTEPGQVARKVDSAPKVWKGNSMGNIFAEDPLDPKTFSVKVDFSTVVPFPELLKQVPTQSLYKLRDLIDEVLGQRDDARK